MKPSFIACFSILFMEEGSSLPLKKTGNTLLSNLKMESRENWSINTVWRKKSSLYTKSHETSCPRVVKVPVKVLSCACTAKDTGRIRHRRRSRVRIVFFIYFSIEFMSLISSQRRSSMPLCNIHPFIH